MSEQNPTALGDRDRPRVVVLRPDDGRLEAAVAALEEKGAVPVPDPMLAVEPTGRAPRTDAEYVIFTSATGVEIARDQGWAQRDASVCAIGETTAAELRKSGYSVDVVPAEYSSSGLVETLRDRVAGDRVEVARSDHGSATLLDGLEDAGAYLHETVLYRLVRPADSGRSTEVTAAGEVDAVLFTSSLTVEHFLEAAAERGIESAVRSGLENAVVAAIGEPTARTAENLDIGVDVVADVANFERLVEEALGATPTRKNP